MTHCVIRGTHCESCGSSDPEDVGFEAAQSNDGYSTCCNEIISYGPQGCRNHHADRN